MFGQDIRSLFKVEIREIDVVSCITDHPKRPAPLRDFDQIRMHSGSELMQAKLMADYFERRRVVFLGDSDCMSLVVGILAKEKVIQAPERMLVLDFDMRLLKFIKDVAEEFDLQDMLDVHETPYNVRHAVPKELLNGSDVFYTNPPYGRWCDGESVKIFLGRCMELCRTGRSWGCAVIPFTHKEDWSRSVMGRIQRFLIEYGYVVTEMLRDLHLYSLDDAPRLQSSSVVFDRVQDVPPPYQGRSLSDEELVRFYGRKVERVPAYIDESGTAIYDELA